MQPPDFRSKIIDLLGHGKPVPSETATPIRHFETTHLKIVNLGTYAERKFYDSTTSVEVSEGHLEQLRLMALLHHVENMERFIKELAAACVNRLVPLTTDDRLEVFADISASQIAAHFETGNLGQALCESAIWLDNRGINDRFRKVLSMPGEPKNAFELLANKNNSPNPRDDDIFSSMQLLWQIRNTVVHNVGIVTKSDSRKLNALAKSNVSRPMLLNPTKDDIRYVGDFLLEVANTCNLRVLRRLEGVLDRIHAESPGLFDPLMAAQDMADTLDAPAAVAGSTANPKI